MKKSIVTVIAVWLLSVGSANAFVGGLWDSTVDLFGSAYDYATDYFVDSSDDTRNEATEDYDSDDYVDSSWWNWDNWTGGDDEDPYALNSNSCAPATDSWCTICSYGFDLLSEFFDNIEYTCNKDNYMVAAEPNQSTETDGLQGSTPQLDQKAYCACLGTQEDFPAPGSMDIIENLIDNRKSDLINSAFAEFQRIASDMATLALNPDLVNNLSANSACLPGNFARLEAALFNAPEGQEPACDASFKTEIQNSFERQTEICKAKSCRDNPLIAQRPTYDDYKARVGALNQDELGGKDHTSLGSWIDFMMKDEFVENTVTRLNLDPTKKPGMGRILNQGFDSIGYDFLSVVENKHADMAIMSRRTPAQTISKGLAQYLSSGMECSEDLGDGNQNDVVSCDELAGAISQQAGFAGAEGVSNQVIVKSYIAQQFKDLAVKAPALRASLETRLAAMRAAHVNGHSTKAIERVEGMVALMRIFDKVRAHRAPSSDKSDENGDSSVSSTDMNLVLEAVKQHYANKSAQEIETEMNDTARTVNTLKSNDLNKRCNQFIDQMANYCKMMGDGSFSASFFLGTVKKGEDGKASADFDSIPKLAAAVAPSTNKEGQPMTKAEKQEAVKDIEGVLDQLTCYESNQLEGLIQPDEYLEDHPPMVAYVTDENGEGRASWMSCIKACTRSYEYQGEMQQIRYCSMENKCPTESDDPVRTIVEAALEREGLYVSEVRTDADVNNILVQEVEQPGSTTPTNTNGGVFANVDDDSYERTYSSPMSKSKKDYYNSISNNSGSEPMSYNDFVAKNGGTQDPQNRVENGSRSSNGSVSSSSSVINNNGTVETPPVVDPVNGQRMSSEGLEVINNRIQTNNSAIVDASNKVEQIDQQLKQTESAGGEVDSALKAQLDALRAQIDSLKDDNKKLAAERDAEVERIQKARAERRERIASSNGNDALNGGIGGTRIGNPIVPVTGTSTSRSDSVTTGSSGNNDVVSGGSSLPVGDNANTNTGSVSGNNVGSNASGNNNVNDLAEGGAVRLSGTSATGETVSFNANDIIDFGSRSDVTNFDSAVQIALQSSKSAFVFQGKTYVKKGDEFIQVSNVKPQRGIASEIDDSTSVGELTNFNNQMIEKYSGVTEDNSDHSNEVTTPKKVEPVTSSDGTSNVSPAGQQYDTESLWQYLKKAGGAMIDNLFTLPSK